MEERENRGGGGAARAAETLGVTQASGTPRPLRLALKESREPARRRRTVGVGTPALGRGAGGEPEPRGFGAPDLAPQAFPLPSTARRLGVVGKKDGKLRHRLAETVWSWPTPFHFRGTPLSRAPSFGVPGLNLPGGETPGPGTPLQPLTRAEVQPRGPPPAQSHLGQQDEELLLAEGLGAAGTHAPLRRHGPAAPGLADLPLLPDQATGQSRHGAPGGDTPKPASARSAGLKRSPLTRACSLTLGSQLPASPTGPEDKPQTPHPPSLQLSPLGPVLAPLDPAAYVSVDPTLDFCPLLKTTHFPVLHRTCPHSP